MPQILLFDPATVILQSFVGSLQMTSAGMSAYDSTQLEQNVQDCK
jgi:hypothetical protein